MTLRKILSGLSVIALAAVMTPALAESGKSNGQGSAQSSSAKSKSASQGNSAKSTKSDDAAEVETGDDPSKAGLASELKGLNAVKANPSALEHASPNSQVGRIAAYQDAALATAALQQELDAATAALASLPVPARDVANIDAAIATLDPAAADYAATLASLEAERATAQAYEDVAATVAAVTQTVTDAQATEDAALLTASGGRILSQEAIAYIRDVLNI